MLNHIFLDKDCKVTIDGRNTLIGKFRNPLTLNSRIVSDNLICLLYTIA